MRRSRAEVERYISSVQSSSPSLKEKPIKGFLFAKLYYEAKEYELAKRHVSEYLKVQERDPKAHKFLGQLFEKEGEINKAVGCYKRSVDLNPAQKDLVLKVAELLCGDEEQRDSRAEYWVEKAAKLLPGHPAVFTLKEKLLSAQGQQGWNHLFDLLQAELAARPSDPHVNAKLVALYCQDGRLDEAVKHCVAVERRGLLRHSLDWSTVVLSTLREYLDQPSVSANAKLSRRLHRELLLAHCTQLRLTLSGRGLEASLDALRSFDQAMQALSSTAAGQADELSDAFVEMKGHLYLHSATLLLKMAQEKEQQWRAVVDLAALCYLLAYQAPRPRPKVSKGDQTSSQLLELLASDRQSQAGHMLFNLTTDIHTLVKEVVEAFGNRSGQGSLFELLFGAQAPTGTSFLANDDIRSLNSQVPERPQLAKWDSGCVLLHGGDLQHLSWLALQWAVQSQRASLRDWLKQLFPRLALETSKMDTNAPESICLLDLEVFVGGVVFCSQSALQEKARVDGGASGGGGGGAPQRLYEPRCMPLPLLRLLSTDRQREWWDAVYSLIHKRAPPGMSAKLRMIVQHGLSTLRAGEKHGLQPALVIYWARYLSNTGVAANSYYEQKEYVSRSDHYWKVVLPLLDKIRHRRSIPEPLDPLFMHFLSRDIQVSAVKGYEEEAMISSGTLLDIEGKTEEAIAVLEPIDNLSATWLLAQIYQRLSEEAGSGVEETQDRCIMFLKKFRSQLTKICSANVESTEQLPVTMEEVMDLLTEVNQQLGESGEGLEEDEDMEEGPPAHSSPVELSQSAAIRFPVTPSPNKSTLSPSKRPLISPKTPPHWVEDQKTLLQTLIQQVEALKNEVHDLRHNASGTSSSPHHRMYGESYGAAEGLQESYTHPAQSYGGAPLTVSTTGQNVYYNQSPAYNNQYLLRPAANVTPTKGPMYGLSRMPPPPQHMYAAYQQQPTHTPPLPPTAGGGGAGPGSGMYPPQGEQQVFGGGGPLRFDSPATSLLSPYSEDSYYGQPAANNPPPPLPEPGYFTKPPPPAATVQPVAKGDTAAKPLDFGKIAFAPASSDKVPSFGAGGVAQSTPASSSFKFKSNFKSNDGDFTFSGGSPGGGGKHSESLLGLLTSDLPPAANKTTDPQAEMKPPGGSESAQPGIFTFGTKGFSFADAAQQSSLGNGGGGGGVFTNVEQQPFRFDDTAPPPATGPIFGMPATANESDNEDGGHPDEDEDGPHFEPIVPLPDKVDVKTGEEDEEEMFCNRAKLFRFEPDTKEWKERGIGNVKILKHYQSGKVRLLMRREQVLKICANHYILADMLLKPNAGSDKSWVWNAIDYADEQPRTEQLAIRFKTAEEAALFKTQFDEAQRIVAEAPPERHEENEEEEEEAPVSQPPSAPASVFGAQFVLKDGEWDCDVCCVRNNATATKCAACQSDNPNAAPPSSQPDDSEAKGPSTEEGGSASAFSFKFGTTDSASKPAGSAGTGFTGFGAFGASLPSSFKFGTTAAAAAITTPAAATNDEDPPAASKPAPSTAPFGSGFAQFVKRSGQWDCDTCAVRNESSADSCVSCQTPNPSSSSSKPAPPPAFAAPAAAKPSFGSAFGAQFGKKPGQWDCDTCCVTNEASASSCVSCQTPNPSSSGPTTAVPPAPKPAFGSAFGAQFGKKPGQWDCDTCCVTNEASASSCVSCQTPNPSALTTAGPPAPAPKPAFGSVFGAQFGKKPGQWDCDTCCVTNEASANNCVSCQSQNPSATTDVEPPPPAAPTKPSTAAPSNFGAAFAKKSGQWDCDTCLVRNDASASRCVSCQTPCPNAPAAAPSSLAAMFAKKGGQWDCDTCLVRNDSSASHCVSCQTPNPNASSAPPATSSAATAPSSSAFSFSFGTKDASGGGQPAGTGFTAPSGFTAAPFGSSFKFGQSKEKSSVAASSFKFEAPPSGATSGSVSSAAGFSFTMPASSGGFKFGTQDVAGKEESEEPAETPVAATAGSASMFLKNIADQHREKEKVSVSTPSLEDTDPDNPLFNVKPDTLGFGDVAKTEFQFGQKDPLFKGFCRAGEQLFSSLPPTPSKGGGGGGGEGGEAGEEDMYRTEEEDDIQFEPVVPLPDMVDVVTGEEDEQVLYSQRVKLFRFDPAISQWKERGVGNLKFLKNATNGRLRVLMRREQVLKVCANHLITTTMTLKPLAGSDKAWMWLASDFSEGVTTLEQLAAKFKTPELAEEFKRKFDECQRLLLDIPLQTPHKLLDTGRTAHLIRKAEEMKTGLKDLKFFLTDDKTKMGSENEDQGQADASSATPSLAIKPHPHADITGPALEWDNYDLREDALDDTADTSSSAVYADDTADTPSRLYADTPGGARASSPVSITAVRKNLFRFGESGAGGFNFSFQPIVSPAKSPTGRLNQSGGEGEGPGATAAAASSSAGGGATGTDDEQDTSLEEERGDGQYFEPAVPLPDLVDTSTGEEDEQVVFCHRAKMYRYDKDLSQWKERGIGDLKILQHHHTHRVRLIMRRDQVLKLCANHWITADMKLEPMKGSEKAWIWSAMDFGEGADGRVEQLAVRFKLQEMADTFKEAFDEAKTAHDTDHLLTPRTPRVATPPEAAASSSVSPAPPVSSTPVCCGEAAIAILEETTRECTATELSPSDTFHTPDSSRTTPPTASSTTTTSLHKSFMSPPKFVFGTDTLQKIFGSSPPKSSSCSPEGDEEGEGEEESSEASFLDARDGVGPRPVHGSPAAPAFGIPEKAPPQAEAGGDGDSEPEVVFVREPTAEQASLALQLQLPITFFCYQNDAHYAADDDQSDDETYESAVKALNGKLYLDARERRPASIRGTLVGNAEVQVSRGTASPEVQVVWEKRGTPDEEEKARSLQLPPTFFCGLGTEDSDDPTDTDHFETELRKAHEALDAELLRTDTAACSSSAAQAPQEHSPVVQVTEEHSPVVQVTEEHSPVVQVTEKHSPVVQVTEVQSPVVEVTEDHSPVVQVTEEQSPVVQVTEDQSPVVQVTEDHSPMVEVTEAQSPVVEVTEDHSPVVEVTEVQSPVVEVTEAQSPVVEVTEAQSPMVEVTEDQATSQETPEAQGLGQETPEEQAPALEPQTLEPETEPESSTPQAEQSAEAQSMASIGSAPIDLSTKKTSEPEPSVADTTTATTAAAQDFGFNSFGSFSFADLAQNTGEEFAFGKQDSSFSWSNAGAKVFGAAAPPAPKNDGEDEGSGEEDAQNNDIHFEPIVSLPEVETKSGEEEEEILFKERTKLYRWDRDLGQWKERGVGDIKILFHPVKHFYRVLMRREQVLRVCANHTISQAMELKPMNSSTSALVWTATDYTDGEGRIEQLAAKFKTPEIAESFRKTFCECQQRMGQDTSDPSYTHMSRASQHSRQTNPLVFLTVAADGERLGTVTVELFSHVVPKTAENFRALCTGEKGFGFRDSVFHRVIPDFMCQGGDITNRDGTGGKSIFGGGGAFEDENFDVRHTSAGLLSMANRGRNTNSSQFYITLTKAEHLDFKHVVFGWVRDGMDVVRQMGALGTKSGKPSKTILITDCGQL